MQTLRIGTRDSKLAMWQANEVARLLKKVGYKVEIVAVKSTGDLDLTTPLHAFGGTGVFTKVLDDALLRNEIDLAVHSLKDYPTQAPEGIKLCGWLERENPLDVFVPRQNADFLEDTESNATIATGSVRRKAQWKNRYRNHEVENIRGNVPTRLQKVSDNPWAGAVFAAAGLLRLGRMPQNTVPLTWMIPAPAQGVVGICSRSGDEAAKTAAQRITNTPAMQSSTIERQFLRTLEGGCSAPIGAYAEPAHQGWNFMGCVLLPDGSEKVEVREFIPLLDYETAGKKLAEKAIARGADKIMKSIRNAQ